MIKRFTINLLIIFITFMGVIYGYTQSFSLSKFDRFSYAEADNWTSCDTSDLVTAFRYYCKSRNLAIEGSFADALTSFTTTTFNNICSSLGIDPTTLSAELKKTTEGNLGLRFLFSNTGITAYNRIFAEFLQNNDLSVGDEVDNKVLDSYKHYTDSNGNSCLIYIVTNMSAGGTLPTDKIIQKGSLLYSGSYFYNLLSGGVNTFTYDNYTYNLRDNTGYQGYPLIQIGTTTYTAVYGYLGNKHLPYFDCGVSIFQYNDDLYFGAVNYYINSSNDTYFSYRLYNVITQNNGTAENGDTYLTTNNNTINNNTYNNNYTIIYNDGDTYVSDDDDEPDPDTPPEGGGGDDPSGDPDPIPSGPDLPDWQPPSGSGTIGSDGTFDFDLPFSLPNLNIDWSLKDIGHKFPFCIPSDIVSFYQTLAVEPRAPSIDAHIPLGSFYDWHFVADFSQYDRWAVIIRAVEYVGFVIGLIYFTVRMVKG